ncbi:MAG: GNAT family N-acetyltransferase [Nanoarchaeota archaeon]|nr:GNAT family N-acetyltransferase [Nanoarchaeota archaeon]MBU4116484.1 GNAT family N-acetyltransferase [Nanoarchaeota archaeon]
MKIRKTTKKDWKRCKEVIYACIEQVNIIPKMKKFLRKRYTLEGIEKLSKKADMFVFEKSGNVQASGMLIKHEIGMIYVYPKYQRQKIGTMMVVGIEKFAKQKGLKRVYVKALLPAVDFYEKLGYKKTRKKDKEHYKMEKKLK